MSEQDQACCACLKVRYNPVHKNGLTYARWTCVHSDDHVFQRADADPVEAREMALDEGFEQGVLAGIRPNIKAARAEGWREACEAAKREFKASMCLMVDIDEMAGHLDYLNALAILRDQGPPEGK